MDGDFFKKVFQSIGFCNAQDGSENHLVTVGSDVVDYDIDAGGDELVVISDIFTCMCMCVCMCIYVYVCILQENKIIIKIKQNQ